MSFNPETHAAAVACAEELLVGMGAKVSYITSSKCKSGQWIVHAQVWEIPREIVASREWKSFNSAFYLDGPHLSIACYLAPRGNP